MMRQRYFIHPSNPYEPFVLWKEKFGTGTSPYQEALLKDFLFDPANRHLILTKSLDIFLEFAKKTFLRQLKNDGLGLNFNQMDLVTSFKQVQQGNVPFFNQEQLDIIAWQKKASSYDSYLEQAVLTFEALEDKLYDSEKNARIDKLAIELDKNKSHDLAYGLALTWQLSEHSQGNIGHLTMQTKSGDLINLYLVYRAEVTGWRPLSLSLETHDYRFPQGHVEQVTLDTHFNAQKLAGIVKKWIDTYHLFIESDVEAAKRAAIYDAPTI